MLLLIGCLYGFFVREGSSKKSRQDEFFGATMEEIDEMMNFGFRRRRSRGSV
jgi:hypothetical protein